MMVVTMKAPNAPDEGRPAVGRGTARIPAIPAKCCGKRPRVIMELVRGTRFGGGHEWPVQERAWKVKCQCCGRENTHGLFRGRYGRTGAIAEWNAETP
jgi:hypothetical protein